MNTTTNNTLFKIVLPNELDELKLLRQWVCYRTELRDNGKVSKIPVNPNTGKNAQSNDSSTWGTYDDAVRGVNQYHLAGIGFEFANGYTGIDLDDVLYNGELKEFALEIVNYFDSYTECSPSGNGLHILCKNSFNISSRNDKLGLEIYSHSRFFTITGNVYGTVKPIEKRTEQVRNIYQQYFNKKAVEIAPLPNINIPIPEDDNQLWQMMFSNKRNGAEIKKLFNGDISDYENDNSRADLALCSYLSYWTKGDIKRIDKTFSESNFFI